MSKETKTGRKNRSYPGRRLAPVRGGRWHGKGVEGECCAKNMYICVNAKMITVETVPGIRGGEIRGSSGGE
jgi:hypothetical protein